MYENLMSGDSTVVYEFSHFSSCSKEDFGSTGSPSLTQKYQSTTLLQILQLKCKYTANSISLKEYMVRRSLANGGFNLRIR